MPSVGGPIAKKVRNDGVEKAVTVEDALNTDRQKTTNLTREYAYLLFTV